MPRLKRELVLHQVGEDSYRVEQAKNTTDYQMKTTISKSKVDQLIQDGKIHITIKPPKIM